MADGKDNNSKQVPGKPVKIGQVVGKAKLADGTEVEITFDKAHHRAYDKAGKQVGLEFMVLDELMKNIGGKLPEVKTPAAE